MRPPGKYDALRQAEQQAQEGSATSPQSETAAQPDSAQEEPTRPTRHAATFAEYKDNGAPATPQTASFDLAEIGKAAKEREDAANQAKEQDRGKGGNER